MSSMENLMKPMNIEQHPDFDHHEVVEMKTTDQLTAIIAVHNSNLGPAVGGCRIFPYTDMSAALTDVLRLSRGMTYKSALAGLPLGGGKAVIVADPKTDKTPQLLHAMGDFVNSLGGRYVTAEDSGTTVADIEKMAERTRFVSGVVSDDQFGGDPSPLTAYGVFVGIREAVAYRHGSLDGVRVAIQGVGNVGRYLMKMLLKSGAVVTAADVNPENVRRARSMGATIVEPSEIHAVDIDVYAPCALGGAISHETIGEIRAAIVAGAANNQLAAKGLGQALKDRGVLYAPDYVINAGGIIDVYYQQRDRHDGGRDHNEVADHIDRIGSTLRRIFELSDRKELPTNMVADHMAEAIFNGKKPGDASRLETLAVA